MRFHSIILGLTLALPGMAQLEVPVPIVLDGPTDADRQVIGLSDPAALDAATSVDAARSGSLNYTAVNGTSILEGDLQPEPVSYTVGMSVTILPSEANASGAQLDLNGLGAHPIMKWGQVPLDSADLVPGHAAKLVFDGTNFLLLSNAYRPCPKGFSAVSSTSCISDSIVSIGSYEPAVLGCDSIGARLCTFAEWVGACRNKPGFIGTVTALEWVDDGTNSGAEGKTMGTGSTGTVGTTSFSCEYGSSSVFTTPRRFRCCMNR
jgi:hypothetical protein